MQNKIKKGINQLIIKLKLNLNQVKDTGIVDAQQIGSSIPKIIHQVYSSDKNLPDEIKQNIIKLKKMNPDWEYRFYSDEDIENYIAKHYPQTLQYYKKINPKYGAARADFFRYLVMYKEGGVYLDIKSSLLQPLNEIIRPDDQYILAHWPDERGRHWGNEQAIIEFQQWHIIAVAGHPFLKAVIENVCNNIAQYNPFLHEKGFIGVLKTTGPIAYTLSILPIMHLYKYRLGFDKEFGLIYSIFSKSVDTKHHQTLFKTHYTQLMESIVKQPRLIALMFNAVRKLKN